MPKLIAVASRRFPAEGEIVNSKYAEPFAPRFNAPVRAAAPALLPPENPVYPLEADVVVSSGVVPLLLPCVTVPPRRSAVRPLVGSAVVKFHVTALGGGALTTSVAGLLIATLSGFVT